ncbi:Protein of unknown function [Pyronema omphalodes CBS 100304]|uniref:Uncharacterized protein n=1 Tax=Pyronema omphalodes (strain CBS 100304) TaxID=1076935 RepID=U4LE71_PYROM|nr:Protein of unknown function [Pyronema omphalodes CBS 100304]
MANYQALSAGTAEPVT